MELRTEVTRVGNSLGLIIPSAMARKNGLAYRDRVIIKIVPVMEKSRFFGVAKSLPSGQSVKDDERRNWS